MNRNYWSCHFRKKLLKFLHGALPRGVSAKGEVSARHSPCEQNDLATTTLQTVKIPPTVKPHSYGKGVKAGTNCVLMQWTIQCCSFLFNHYNCYVGTWCLSCNCHHLQTLYILEKPTILSFRCIRNEWASCLSCLEHKSILDQLLPLLGSRNAFGKIGC